MDLRHILMILFKHWVSAVIVFLTILLIIVLVTFLMQPTYEATSTLLVKFGRDYINRPEVGDTRPLISQEEVINSEIQIIYSRDLIEKVITAINIEKIYPDFVEKPPAGITPLQASIMKFQEDLKADGVKKSNVITVSFRHKNPEMAARTLNLLMEMYKEKHLQMFSNEAMSSFQENALISYRQQLKDSEVKLEYFKQKHRVFSLDEQVSLLLKQRAEIDMSLKNTQSHINEFEKRLSTLKQEATNIAGDKSLYTQTERDRIVVEAQSKLINYQIEKKELLLKYKSDNPLVVKVQSEIDLLQNFLNEQERDIMIKVKTGNLVYQDAKKQILTTQADLNSQQAKVSILESQLNSIDNELMDIDSQKNELASLIRERDIYENNYKTFSNKVTEARIADEISQKRIANVSVIQAAGIPPKPIKPKKLINIILGIILGIGSAISYTFIINILSKRLSNPYEVERNLGLKVLVSIPYRK